MLVVLAVLFLSIYLLGGVSMQWWPIAKHLADYLGERPENSGFAVYPGTKGNAKPAPCIEVLWDEEGNLSIHKSNQGKVILWVDIWLRSDSIDDTEAYQQQYESQVNILSVLKLWQKELNDDLGIAIKVDCPGVVSEGTIKRPTFGCRMILDIDWRKEG